ncbi:D-alanyl-D-alanine carboxypeptidase family protein [Chelativorans sp. Marseille-P2723]|uniref:D-alanyl-D-alanine carboxypeptidase family protein n=1 Tax=Chelativorans sp. Marseille-P2723 TaxID=2709133 RepID=UPI001FEEDC7F|nr:D-alanyl-D-alanine carboxypeptidase family protein [Chelativorans sp. Marseille-P2723]
MVVDDVTCDLRSMNAQKIAASVLARIANLALVLLALLIFVVPGRSELFETKASSAYMIDAETGTVLFSKAPDQLFPPASLAKLMTIELVFQALKNGHLSLDQTFPVSEYAWRTGGAPSRTATMFAAVNSSVPVEALIQGIIVQSANDGCIVIAQGMAGSEENFARMMTERARELGLTASTFVNSTGLPAEGQWVTARELTQLAQHLWQTYPSYYRYFSQPAFEWNNIFQRNRNPLLTRNIGADGLKTGFTEESGYSIVASAARGGRRLFVTLAGMESEEEREEEASRLLDWGMTAFEKRQIFAANEIVGEAQVYGGEREKVTLRTDAELTALVPTEEGSISGRIIYEGPVPAPIEEGSQIARLELRVGDTRSHQAPLYAAETVDRGSLRQRAQGAVWELLVGWLR